MKLLLQNHCSNEFLPGCDATVVDIDDGLVALAMKRAEAFRQLAKADPSLSAVRYWDDHPACINDGPALLAAAGDPDRTLCELLEDV